MQIRAYRPDDLDEVLALTLATFRPFYREHFPAMVGHDPVLVEHQHGAWDDDYRREIPTLHDPAQGRFVAVAEQDGRVVGYVAWAPDGRERLQRHAEIALLAVAPDARGHGVGKALMGHAMTELRAAGYEFVELGTGGDEFHAAARGLYESLGFHAIPVTAYLRRL